MLAACPVFSQDRSHRGPCCDTKATALSPPCHLLPNFVPQSEGYGRRSIWMGTGWGMSAHGGGLFCGDVGQDGDTAPPPRAAPFAEGIRARGAAEAVMGALSLQC